MVFLWLAVLLLAVLAELVTVHFGVMFCAVGAAAAALLALAGLPFLVQVAAFALVSVLALGLLRRRLIRRFLPRGVPNRTEALLGQVGRVTEAIDPVAGRGRVIVAGEDWAARSTVAVPSGTTVTVYAADGIVLHVVPGDPTSDPSDS